MGLLSDTVGEYTHPTDALLIEVEEICAGEAGTEDLWRFWQTFNAQLSTSNVQVPSRMFLPLDVGR